MNLCSIPDCDRPATVKGLCIYHYQKARTDADKAKHHRPKPQRVSRTCLVCSRSFPSEGAYNRICPRKTCQAQANQVVSRRLNL